MESKWKPIGERPKESVPIITGEWREKLDSTMYWFIWTYMSDDPWLNSQGRLLFYQPELPDPPPQPEPRKNCIYTGIL